MIKRKHWIFRHILSVLAVYYYLCNYGESVLKPISWLALVILGGFFYWTLFFIYGYDETTKNIEMSNAYSNVFNLPIILKSIEKDDNKTTFNEQYQFSYNETLKRKEISITNSTILNESLPIKVIKRTFSNIFSINENMEPGDILIRISSLIVLGGLAISIRRKIERKFRH